MASKNSASSSSEDAKAELAALLKRKNEVEVRNLLYSAETLTVSTFYFPHGLVCIAMNGARWGGIVIAVPSFLYHLQNDATACVTWCCSLSAL